MDIHNVMHVATGYGGDADSAPTHASGDQSAGALTLWQVLWRLPVVLILRLSCLLLAIQSDDDAALLFKRKYDELNRLFIETQQVLLHSTQMCRSAYLRRWFCGRMLRVLVCGQTQDREQLARRYAAVQKQLERVHVENEYLMAELSRYAPSDLESDQSDIELHYTPHARRSLLPSPTTTEGDAIASSKAKFKSSPVVKVVGTPTKDAATKPKRRRASTSTAPASASSTAPKKLSPKPKKPKKATE